MTSSPSADKRVPRPIRISKGRTCSATAAIGAATSGAISGSLYSSWNSDNAESDSRGQPSVKSPLTRLIAKPWTLVCPEFQNTAAIEKRATTAIRLCGMRSNRAMAAASHRTGAERLAGVAGSACRVGVFMMGLGVGVGWR